MIAPNMATMLAVVMTDAELAPEIASVFLGDAVNDIGGPLKSHGAPETDRGRDFRCSPPCRLGLLDICRPGKMLTRSSLLHKVAGLLYSTGESDE